MDARQELFNHMKNEHDLILLEGEMDEIIDLALKSRGIVSFEDIAKAFKIPVANGICIDTSVASVIITGEQIAEPCIVQSAFEYASGRRIIIYASWDNGINTFECDENWKEKTEKPYASTPCMSQSPIDYHKHIRGMDHNIRKLIIEHSTDLTPWP